MTQLNIQLRPATIDDLPLLLKWDEEPHVIESDPNDDWQWETELLRSPQWREQLVAEINGRPIGFVQIIDPALEDDHYWGDVPNNLRAIDIWLGNAEDLGKGYGTEIMKQAINICFSNQNVVAILIDPLSSNKRAHRFYEKFGFKFLEERQFGLDNCYVYKLDRKDWKE